VGVLAFISIHFIDSSLGWSEFSRFGYLANEPHLGKLMQVAGYLALPIAFGGLLVLSVTAAPDSALSRVFCSGVMRTLGKYSYALYLFHLPLRAVIRDTLFGPKVDGPDGPLVEFPIIAGSQLPAQCVFWIVSSAATLAVAWLSWHLYEKHFLKLKKYFEYRTPRDPDAEPAHGAVTGVVLSGRTPALSAER
ncbi:MAG: acyltransferase family protein, partial [Phycisphaerales bacterium]